MYWNKDFYRVNISEKELQSRLERLIAIREKNSIQNHAFPSNRESEEKVRGELSENKFTIWRTNKTLNGIFYPIFKCNVQKINGINIVQIKTRFNPIAEIIVLFLTLGIGYGILTEIIIQSNNELKFLFRRSLIGILLFLIFQSVPLISYYNLKNKTLKGVQEYLELTKVKLKKRKQR